MNIDWTNYNSITNKLHISLMQGEEKQLQPEEVLRINILLAKMEEEASEVHTFFIKARERFLKR